MSIPGDKIGSRRKPRVVIRFKDGWWTVHSDRGEVEIICIDEACARDRVYLCSDHKEEPGVIDEMIGDSRVGRKGDMPGVEAEIRAFMNGEQPPAKPTLALVKSEADAEIVSIKTAIADLDDREGK